ncbi:hypothetical protein [Thermophilibacter sp.]
MRRELALAGALALAIGLPLVGCNGTSAEGGSAADGTSASESQSADFDAVEAYWGQWRGSVATTETTIYGNAGGTEPMLDVNLGQDGSCTVEPLEAHADLPSDEGTWEGTESEVTLHLSGGDIVLTVVDQVTLEGNAADFGIADFDTIQFDFYG